MTTLRIGKSVDNKTLEDLIAESTENITASVIDDGNVSEPGLKFTNDTDTGIYRIGDNNFGISCGGTGLFDLNTTRLMLNTDLCLPAESKIENASLGESIVFNDAGTAVYFTASGTERLRIDSTKIQSERPIWMTNNGDVSNPQYSFNNDTNTGMYLIGTDNLGVTCGGNEIIDVGTSSVSFNQPIGLPSYATASLPAGVSGQLVYDSDKSSVKTYNGSNWKQINATTQIFITSEDDFTTETNPMGVLSNVLVPGNTYILDVYFLSLTRPFWLKYEEDVNINIIQGCNLLAASRGTLIQYSGTDPLFWGRNVTLMTTYDIYYISTAGADLFNLGATLNPNIFSYVLIENAAVIGFALGIISNFRSMAISRCGFNGISQGLTTYNQGRATIDTVSVNAFGDNFIWWSKVGNINGSFFNWATMTINGANSSLFAIDTNATIAAEITIKSMIFTTDSTNFYQPDQTGSITSIADLSSTSGTISNIIATSQSASYIVCELSGSTGLYLSMNLTITGTTNYNGTHRIAQISQESPNYIVYLETAYIADEATGSYSAESVEVTTSTDHFLTPYRTTTISGTTSYNNTYEVINPTGSTFIINEVFVASETGSYLTQSYDQTFKQIQAETNGASPNSEVIGSSILTTLETYTVNTSTLTQINTGTFIEAYNERFILNADGSLTLDSTYPVEARISVKMSAARASGSTIVGEINFMIDTGSGFAEVANHRRGIADLRSNPNFTGIFIPTITLSLNPGDSVAVGILANTATDVEVQNMELSIFV